MTQTPMTMEERFDKTFGQDEFFPGEIYDGCKECGGQEISTELKDFIRQELSLLESAHDVKIARLREAIINVDKQVNCIQAVDAPSCCQKQHVVDCLVAFDQALREEGITLKE